MVRFISLVVSIAVLLQLFVPKPVLESSLSVDSTTVAQTPEPSKANVLPLNRYLKHCGEKLCGECGKVLFDALFARKTGAEADCIGAEDLSQEISHQCCQDLVIMGKDCHEAFVNTIASLKRYEKYTKLIIQNGEENWKRCIAESATPPLALH